MALSPEARQKRREAMRELGKKRQKSFLTTLGAGITGAALATLAAKKAPSLVRINGKNHFVKAIPGALGGRRAMAPYIGTGVGIMAASPQWPTKGDRERNRKTGATSLGMGLGGMAAIAANNRLAERARTLSKAYRVAKGDGLRVAAGLAGGALAGHLLG